MISHEHQYQYNFSEKHKDEMYNIQTRERKAATIVAVLRDHLKSGIRSSSVIDIGCSTGIITNLLSFHVNKIVGIDIDETAIDFAKKNHLRNNLTFKTSDAMHICYPDNNFDIAICAHIYEHVPDASILMSEIYRVLKPGGICYFAAGNRLNIIEAHYQLPFLSIIPKRFAHFYLRLTNKGTHYYEKHLTHRGLKKLTRDFEIIDYTGKIIENPIFFHAEYMIKNRSLKAIIARKIVKYAYFLCPGYIWLLRKKE